MSRSEEILAFWFGAPMPGEPPAPDRMQLWFRGGDDVDRQIRERFGADVEQARRGELHAWAETPRGRLALIVLLDQFSRNIYRGSPEAFAKDSLALELAVAGLDSGQDAALTGLEPMFFVLPLGHSEDLAMQDRSLAYCEAWVKSLLPALQGMGQGALGHAREHRNVIARFGRFPTRNQALGRPSTPEEEAHVREAKTAGRPV
jgi:uncharacterized protein (DUF924 family)